MKIKEYFFNNKILSRSTKLLPLGSQESWGHRLVVGWVPLISHIECSPPFLFCPFNHHPHIQHKMVPFFPFFLIPIIYIFLKNSLLWFPLWLVSLFISSTLNYFPPYFCTVKFIQAFLLRASLNHHQLSFLFFF